MATTQSILTTPPITVQPTDLAGTTLQQGGNRAPDVMAKEFEAMFLSLLLKEMRQSLESGGLFPGDTGDVQGGLFDLFMSNHLADAGGVGMAAAILKQIQLDKNADASGLPSNRGKMPAASRP